MEIPPADCSKEGFGYSMYRGALVSGNVNISVYFNKLANNCKTAG